MKIKISHSQLGQSLLELMISISLMTIVGTCLIEGMKIAYQGQKINQVKNTLQELASDKMEEISAINPNSIDISNYPVIENNLSVDSFKLIKFNRSTSLIPNPDRSKTIIITVTSNQPQFAQSVQISKTIPSW